MGQYSLQWSRLIPYRRHLLLVSALALFGFLASVVAPPVAAWLIIRVRPTYGVIIGNDSAFVVGAHFGFDNEDSDIRVSLKPRRRIDKRSAKHKTNLSDEIAEQKRILAGLESEANKKVILEQIGDDRLLLILNTRFFNQLNFINRWLNSPAEDKSETESFENVAFGDKMALNVLLQAPNVIDIAQTVKVEVSMDWSFPDELSIPKTLPVIEAILESPDFKIAPSKADGQNLPKTKFRTKQLSWVWLVSPEKTGDRKLSLSFKSSDNQLLPILRAKETKDYDVLIPITVLTDLGLSSTQYAWAKAVGAIIGIIGTIAGYSFWQYRKRKRDTVEDDTQQSEDDPKDDESLDAEIILRALARHLRDQETRVRSDAQLKSDAVEKN